MLLDSSELHLSKMSLKIQTFISSFSEMSLFIGTYYMYFPFLTCKVKCGAAALDVADRQNAHSMALAVRGIFLNSLDL
jgi:hypothetical protein